MIRRRRSWWASWLLAFVVACAGSGPDTGVPVNGGDTLPTPSNVVSVVDGDEVLITWELAATEGLEALVFRAVVVDEVGSGFVTAWHLLGVVPGDVHRWRDADVALGTSYAYAVAARRGSRSTEPVLQSNPPVIPGVGDGPGPPLGPVAIERFEVSPRRGTGAVTATFSWLLGEQSEGVVCRLSTGDGLSVELDDCDEVTTYEHTYAADASGVLVATLETIRFDQVRRERRGIAVNVNPDESRYVALAAQRADGLPVAGALRPFGNVQVVAIDRLGGVDVFSAHLDDHGSAVIATYSEGPTDLTPYTLLALLNTSEAYGTVLTSFDGVAGPGTLYVDAEAPDLARVTFGTRTEGDRLSAAYVVHEDTHGAGGRPPVNCCIVFDQMRPTSLVHAEPRAYRFVFAGVTGAGEAFFLSDEIDVDGDLSFVLDPASRPHGRLRVSALDRWGQPLDFAIDLVLEEASFWPREGSRTGWVPNLGTRAAENLLHPGAYSVSIARVLLGSWDLWFSSREVSIDVASVTELEFGGDLRAAMRVEDASRPGDEYGTVVRAVRLYADVTDESGNRVWQVFDYGATDQTEVRARFRVYDPAGTLALDAEAEPFSPGSYRFELPDGVPEGTYTAEMTWHLGPFADAPLTAQATFEVAD